MNCFKYLLFTLTFFSINTAHAQEINDRGAQKLKSSFQEFLNYQKSVNEAFGSARVSYEGELSVTQEPEYYTITFPHIFVKGPEAKTEGEDPVFDMGVIVINAVPDEKPGYWKTILTLPSKMTLSDDTNEGDTPFSITFEEQRSIALYNDELGYFTKMDLNLSGIGFETADSDVDMNIGGIQLYMKMEEQKNGRFSGPGHFLFNNLSFTPAQEEGALNIGEFKMDFSINDFKFPSLKNYSEKILKHQSTLQSLNNLEGDIEEVNGKGVIDMIYDFYDFDMDGFSFAYSMKDLNFDADTSNEDINFEKLHIGSALMGVSVEGLKSDAGNLGLKWNFDSFKTTPEDQDLKTIVPQELNINIEAQKVPFKSLSDIANNTVQAIAQDPGSMQMAGLGVLMRLPAILSQSGTQIIINGNKASNEIYDLSLNGEIATDLSSFIGFSARFEALFEGLDALLNIANDKASDEESAMAAEFQNIAEALTQLKSIGNPQKGPNGKSAYNFIFETTPQGQFTVNGQDAATAMSPPAE